MEDKHEKVKKFICVGQSCKIPLFKRVLMETISDVKIEDA